MAEDFNDLKWNICYLAGIFSSFTLFSSVYFGKSECTPTNAMPASPLEPVLGMVETDGIDTVDNGFFSWNTKKDRYNSLFSDLKNNHIG